MEVLSRRELNRATLARQLLLCRAGLPVPDVLERVVGLQAQAPNPPYVGLWTRVAGFVQEDLASLVRGRAVVRMALLRSTIHLVTAEDCLWLRPLVQPVLERGLSGAYGKALSGVDVAEVAAAGRELLREGPLTFAALGELLASRWPGCDGQALAMAVRTGVPLVQVPPRGLWGFSGPAAHAPVDEWLGRPVRDDASLEELVWRYLAGFGPASVKDVQVVRVDAAGGGDAPVAAAAAGVS